MRSPRGSAKRRALAGGREDADEIDVGAVNPPDALVMQIGRKARSHNAAAYPWLAGHAHVSPGRLAPGNSGFEHGCWDHSRRRQLDRLVGGAVRIIPTVGAITQLGAAPCSPRSKDRSFERGSIRPPRSASNPCFCSQSLQVVPCSFRSARDNHPIRRRPFNGLKHGVGAPPLLRATRHRASRTSHPLWSRARVERSMTGPRSATSVCSLCIAICSDGRGNTRKLFNPRAGPHRLHHCQRDASYRPKNEKHNAIAHITTATSEVHRANIM